MSLGQRLGTALEKLDWRVSDLANKSGVAAPTIRILIKRGSNRTEYLEQILSALPPDRVNVEWVRTGLGNPDEVAANGNVLSLSRPAGKEESRAAAEPYVTGENGLAAPLRSWEHPAGLPQHGDWVLIPRLGVLAPAPGSTEVKIVKLQEEVQLFRSSWIRDDQLKPASLVWQDAIDTSMEPHIYKGDNYVLDTSQTEVVDGGVYGIWYAGAVRPRRVSLLPTGAMRLKPSNTEFEAVDIPAADVPSIRVLGRVVRREGKGGL